MTDWKIQETWLTIMLIFETESLWKQMEKSYSYTNLLALFKSFIPSPTDKHIYISLNTTENLLP